MSVNVGDQYIFKGETGTYEGYLFTGGKAYTVNEVECKLGYYAIWVYDDKYKSVDIANEIDTSFELTVKVLPPESPKTSVNTEGLSVSQRNELNEMLQRWSEEEEITSEIPDLPVYPGNGDIIKNYLAKNSKDVILEIILRFRYKFSGWEDPDLAKNVIVWDTGIEEWGWLHEEAVIYSLSPLLTLEAAEECVKFLTYHMPEGI